MPPKITSKNLSYDTTLPPFLQNLQNNYDRGVESRDGRHENALLRGRPKRARNADEEEEDEPVYVDESGNVVDKEGLAKGEGGEGEKDGDEKGSEGKDGDEIEEGKKIGMQSDLKAKENLVSIGSKSKKRKLGKVIGADTDATVTTTISEITTTSKPLSRKLPKASKSAKLARGMKVSFGGDESDAEEDTQRTSKDKGEVKGKRR